MKEDNFKGYREVVSIPGWLLMEHPKEFHFVLVERKKKAADGTYRIGDRWEWTSVGLSQEEDVKVPMGFIRAMVKRIGRGREEEPEGMINTGLRRVTRGLTQAPPTPNLRNLVGDRIFLRPPTVVAQRYEPNPIEPDDPPFER